MFASIQGILCRTLQGHGHWVNTMALCTDYVMRTGAFDPAHATIVHKDVKESGRSHCNYCFSAIALVIWQV